MDIRKLAVAMAIGGASLGAGFSLASAQTEAPSTTAPPSTEAPAQPDAERDGRNCDKDGDGVPDNQQGEGSSATETGFFRS
jgi:hypothetical protein